MNVRKFTPFKIRPDFKINMTGKRRVARVNDGCGRGGYERPPSIDGTLLKVTRHYQISPSAVRAEVRLRFGQVTGMSPETYAAAIEWLKNFSPTRDMPHLSDPRAARKRKMEKRLEKIRKDQVK